MAYDEKLAARITGLFKGRRGVTTKKMFGGLCILLNGNMALGVVDDMLMVRVGPDNYEACLRAPHVRPMDFTGKPLKGMIYVAREGIKTPAALKKWVEAGIGFARSLPPK